MKSGNASFGPRKWSQLQNACTSLIPSAMALLVLPAACDAAKKTDASVIADVSAKPIQALTLVAEAKASCKNPLIDDLEARKLTILPTDSRGGYWYTFKDSLGTAFADDAPYEPASSGARQSKGSAHVSGKMATAGLVYAGIGFNFTKAQLPYDLSAGTGICFFAKGTGIARVSLPDINTVPEGGLCKACYNTFGRDFKLSHEWREFCWKFDQLEQNPHWGDQVAAFATNAAFGMQWRVSAPNTAFDLWVDDIRLTCD